MRVANILVLAAICFGTPALAGRSIGEQALERRRYYGDQEASVEARGATSIRIRQHHERKERRPSKKKTTKPESSLVTSRSVETQSHVAQQIPAPVQQPVTVGASGQQVAPGGTLATPAGAVPGAPECLNGRVADANGDCYTGCPENSLNEVPDEDGNCQCLLEYLCYDNEVMHLAGTVAKELKPANGQKVMAISQEDQKEHPPGCSMNMAGQGNMDAKDAIVCVSQVKFAHSCLHCKCEARPPAQSGASVDSFAISILCAFAFMSNLGF